MSSTPPTFSLSSRLSIYALMLALRLSRFPLASLLSAPSSPPIACTVVHAQGPVLTACCPLSQDSFVREAIKGDGDWIVCGKKIFRNPYPTKSVQDITDISGGCVALTGFHAALKITDLGLTLQLDTNVSAFCHPFSPGYNGPEIADTHAGEAVNVLWQAAGFNVSS